MGYKGARDKARRRGVQDVSSCCLLKSADTAPTATRRVRTKAASECRRSCVCGGSAWSGQLLTVIGVYWGLGFTFPIGLCLALIAISAWVNVFLRILYPARYRLSSTFATTLLAWDIAELALLLYLTGGIENPFMFLIVAPVTVSAATLPARNTVLLGILAVAATILLVEWHLPLPWASEETFRPAAALQGRHGGLHRRRHDLPGARMQHGCRRRRG